MQAPTDNKTLTGLSSRLDKLGIVLPAPPTPLGAYVEGVRYKTVQAGYLTANRCKVMPTKTNPSPEPALIMKAVIICDEFAFVASAASTLARVGRQAAVNVEWITRCWPTNAFKDITFADNALNEAVDAHLILFSAQCALPAWVLDWLSRWAARRSVQTAALGVIRDWNAAAVTKPMLQELWEFAHEYGLNFVVDERPAARNPSRVLVNFPIERELALPVAQVCSTDLDTQGSYRCFGINE